MTRDRNAVAQAGHDASAKAIAERHTCSPSRRRTIQNSSTVSKTSEIEVAAAAVAAGSAAPARRQSRVHDEASA